MKKLLLLFFPILIFLVACKKNDALTPVSNEGNGWWALGLDSTYSYQFITKKTTFIITKVERQTTNNNFILIGTSALPSQDSLQIYFAAEPKFSKRYASTTYRFFPYTNYNRLDTNQIGLRVKLNIPPATYDRSVFFGTSMLNNYLNKRADSIDVSVNNGKIKVVIPRLLTTGFIANQDSATLQGVLIEK